jgi:hypothetical protein
VPETRHGDLSGQTKSQATASDLNAGHPRQPGLPRGIRDFLPLPYDRFGFDTIQELKTQLQRSDIVPIDRASIALGIPASELDTIWAASDTIKIINLGLWRFITLKDFDKLKAIQAECLTARQAGKLFGMHRSHLPNLERQGRITSTTLGSRRRIKLYKKADVLKELDRINREGSTG